MKIGRRHIDTRRVVVALAVVATLLLLITRSRHDVKPPAVPFDRENDPTMFTADAVSFISDSGFTRYMLKAPLWYVFDEAQDPKWRFDRGLYLEKYDDTMGIAATFTCDSAIFLSEQRLWEFIGNVVIHNENGDRFMTSQMFWDQNAHKLYSDSFMHIERSDRIVEGYGFSSDEHIANYEVNNPSMILPMTDFTRGDGDPSASGPAVDPDDPDDADAHEANTSPTARPAAAKPSVRSLTIRDEDPPIPRLKPQKQ